MPSSSCSGCSILAFPFGVDLQPPGLGGEPRLDQGLALERMRDRVAAADVPEFVGVGQERPLIGHESCSICAGIEQNSHVVGRGESTVRDRDESKGGWLLHRQKT